MMSVPQMCALVIDREYSRERHPGPRVQSIPTAQQSLTPQTHPMTIRRMPLGGAVGNVLGAPPSSGASRYPSPHWS